jgi:hypothetical protein
MRSVPFMKGKSEVAATRCDQSRGGAAGRTPESYGEPRRDEFQRRLSS